MDFAHRRYAAAGAAAGAAVVVALVAGNPPAPPQPDVAIALTSSGDPAFLNPVTEWVNVLTTAGTNLETLGGIVAADPFPILSQYVSNQIGYAQTLDEGLQAAHTVLDAARQGLPATLETASHDIASGNIVGGVEDVWNHAGSFGTGGLFVAIGDVFQAIRTVAEEMAGNVDSFVATDFDGNPHDISIEQYANTPTSPLGDNFGDIAFPVHDAVVSSTYLAQGIVDALGSGDYLTALSDIVNAPAIVTGAVLNGTTENFGPADQLNYAFPDSGLLTSSPIPSPLPFGGPDDPFPAKYTGGSIFDVLWTRLALANAIDPAAAGHIDLLSSAPGALGAGALGVDLVPNLGALLSGLLDSLAVAFP
ncbi:hypothetical protein [Mycobacterium sp.]|uniref:hypothetical protein n=1 Tax=Mycobacterium sp. TaxID=1785 RepID=UPI00128175CF|nr:hypothetical protein [Mycobacterium sp.]KAA8963996.1 MAG: hypothetical protein F6Q13_10465 [Mycobacterium sp.]